VFARNLILIIRHLAKNLQQGVSEGAIRGEVQANCRLLPVLEAHFDSEKHISVSNVDANVLQGLRQRDVLLNERDRKKWQPKEGRFGGLGWALCMG
jgi:hypothetical protein